MSKFLNYVKASYTELTEKVTWPTWQSLQQSTMIVLVATIIITLIIWVIDLFVAGGINALYKMLY